MEYPLRHPSLNINLYNYATTAGIPRRMADEGGLCTNAFRDELLREVFFYPWKDKILTHFLISWKGEKHLVFNSHLQLWAVCFIRFISYFLILQLKHNTFTALFGNDLPSNRKLWETDFSHKKKKTWSNSGLDFKTSNTVLDGNLKNQEIHGIL